MVMMGYKQPSAAEQLCDKTVWRTVIDTITCWVGVSCTAIRCLLGSAELVESESPLLHYYFAINVSTSIIPVQSSSYKNDKDGSHPHITSGHHQVDASKRSIPNVSTISPI